MPVVIGAEGEKRGLRLAARHADIWQWFAGTDQVELFRHKDGVLRQHCETEGGDEREIERMLGCKLIMRSSTEEARRVASELITVHGWPDTIWEAVWAGTPQQVADWLTPFVEAGVGSFSPQIGWPYDRETIERLIGEVKPLVDARTG
jgi:alkanesulfonate monooxygenase SsuD/methylene tetrahydromethanopterin reductase-like flavin-dependent oxidoreductase (luciferase family)